MSAVDLRLETFRSYPADARRLVSSHLELLRRLPIPFASLLLREVIGYDWKFPVERAEVDNDFAFLGSLPEPKFESLMQPFRTIPLPEGSEADEWAADPVAFSEKLSAQLWKSHRIDDFRNAATTYMNNRTAATPKRQVPVPRLTVVVIGRGVGDSKAVLFKKLRPHGTFFDRLKPGSGLADVRDHIVRRAAKHPEPFAHWYVDGNPIGDIDSKNVACVSYDGLAKQRSILQKELMSSFERRTGSEKMRSQLAQKRPEELGLRSTGPGATLDRFALSILTEGSGTQIFSTTFVQWTAREILRRAQPLSLCVRFTPRQREKPMPEMLRETEAPPDLDPHGSLVDADMGAYYTWLNAGRLPGADQFRFLAWFEDHGQAIAIAPTMARGAASEDSLTLAQLLSRLGA